MTTASTTPSDRTPARLRTPDGAALVLVPLANHAEPAILDARDFDALMAARYSPLWTFNDTGNGKRYVRVRDSRMRGHLVLVARLITAAGRGRIVRYRDANPLNLRRSNLLLTQGRTRGHRRLLETGR